MAYHRSLTDEQILEFAEMMHSVSNKELAAHFGVSESTSCSYRKKISGMVGKIKAKNARLEAIERGEAFYDGRACRSCGNTRRYVSDHKCEHCRQKNRKSEYQKSEIAKRVQEGKKKEQLAMIAHHKQNPQLSCVRWG